MLKNIHVKPKILDRTCDKMCIGFVNTKYGEILLGSLIEDDIVHIAYLHFSAGQSLLHFAEDVRKHWPTTECYEDQHSAQAAFSKCFLANQLNTVYVLLNGSHFQNEVWMALLQIPYGEQCTYSDVAAKIGRPDAVRAVANAVAQNNIGLLVPCHRVKAKSNDKLKFRWGSELKYTILMDEKNSSKQE